MTAYPVIGGERQRLVDSLAQTVRLDAELPDLVFSEAITHFYACDILFALGGPYAKVLNRLGASFGDDACYLVSRRPEPSDFEGWGTFGAFRLDLPATEEELWGALNDEPDGDFTASMASNLRSWVVVGSSCRWAVWCDRSYELAVLATGDQVRLSDEEIPFQTVSAQVREMLRLGRGKLPHTEFARFENTYG
jgi:hypothetical protein